MMKASALRAVNVGPVNPAGVTGVLTQRRQNIKIEFSEEAEKVPEAVVDIASRMRELDPAIRDSLGTMRSLFVTRREDFHISLNGLSRDVKKQVVDLFESMHGALTDVHYCPDCDMLNGKLVFSSRAQAFITGNYLEIAVRKAVRDVLEKLEKESGKEFRSYSNVKVATLDGVLKNEFDIVIENVTDSLVYVIEIKSGKHFKDWDKLARVGKEYGIIPDRLLLVDNYLTNVQTDTIEYFCQYYVANLESDNLEKKLITMLSKDF